MPLLTTMPKSLTRCHMGQATHVRLTRVRRSGLNRRTMNMGVMSLVAGLKMAGRLQRDGYGYEITWLRAR